MNLSLDYSLWVKLSRRRTKRFIYKGWIFTWGKHVIMPCWHSQRAKWIHTKRILKQLCWCRCKYMNEAVELCAALEHGEEKKEWTFIIIFFLGSKYSKWIQIYEYEQRFFLSFILLWLKTFFVTCCSYMYRENKFPSVSPPASQSCVQLASQYIHRPNTTFHWPLGVFHRFPSPEHHSGPALLVSGYYTQLFSYFRHI